MVFTFLLHVVGAHRSAGACTSTFPEYEVISHLFYGTVIVASVGWVDPYQKVVGMCYTNSCKKFG